jgi:enamine deaminase RidA (YjgF/YER057c/UK114 family)
MNEIKRLGDSRRWADIVIHQGVARWVEVAEDKAQDTRGQVSQVLAQIDETLLRIGSSRQGLLQVVIYLADLGEAGVLNEVWDAWVPAGHSPVRACVGAALSPGYQVEMIITAAVG